VIAAQRLDAEMGDSGELTDRQDLVHGPQFGPSPQGRVQTAGPRSCSLTLPRREAPR
jgi:hypothetical protein